MNVKKLIIKKSIATITFEFDKKNSIESIALIKALYCALGGFNQIGRNIVPIELVKSTEWDVKNALYKIAKLY